MEKHLLYLFLILIITSCYQNIQPTGNENYEITKMSSPTKTIITYEEKEITKEKLLLHTNTLLTQASIKYECINRINALQPGLIENASLLVSNRNGSPISSNSSNQINFINLHTLEETELFSEEQQVRYVTTSPDRNKIAYFDLNNKELVLYSFINNDKLVYPLKDSWIYIVDWIDDYNIIIKTREENTNKLIVYNIQSNEIRYLPTVFPNIVSEEEDLGWNGWGKTSFNRSLEYVVFGASTSDGYWYIVWDIQKNAAIASIRSMNLYSLTIPPAWSSDGLMVAIVGMPSNNDKNPELFIVTTSGEIRQVTSFSKLTNETQPGISKIVWSHNSKKIAFFYEDFLSDQAEQLSIIDLQNISIVNFCIHGAETLEDSIKFPEIAFTFDVYTPEPIWSLDDKYVFIENRFSVDQSQILILDFYNITAYQLANNYMPIDFIPNN